MNKPHHLRAAPREAWVGRWEPAVLSLELVPVCLSPLDQLWHLKGNFDLMQLLAHTLILVRNSYISYITCHTPLYT